MSNKIVLFQAKYLAEAEMLLKDNLDIFTKEDYAVYRKDLKNYLKDPIPKEDNARAMVIVVNKKVCGLVMIEKAEESKDYYEITWLMVKKSEQGKGYGSLLMKEAIRQIKKIGGKHVIIETSNENSNQKVKNFYQKFGFKKIAVFPDYFPSPIKVNKKTEDAAVYCKKL